MRRPQPPLNEPYYGVGFSDAVRRGYRKYLGTFDGRAVLGEYWWFALYVMGVVFALAVLDGLITGSTSEGGVLAKLAAFFYLAHLLPIISLTIRRLHDTGRSGATWAYTLIPVVGGFIVFVFLCGSTKREADKFGPPYYSAEAAAATPSIAGPYRPGPAQDAAGPYLVAPPMSVPYPAGPYLPNSPAFSANSVAPAAAVPADPAVPVASIAAKQSPGTAVTPPPAKSSRGLVALIAVVVVVGLLAVVVTVFPYMQLVSALRGSAETRGVSQKQPYVPSGDETVTSASDWPSPDAPASTDWASPSETESAYQTPSPEPSSLLDEPLMPDDDGVEAEVWQNSDGKACRASKSNTTFGGYPVATCRFWQTPSGKVWEESIGGKGDHTVAWQRDLETDNPKYAATQANTWWVWAESELGNWDWYPETAIAEGASDQAINGVAICQ